MNLRFSVVRFFAAAIASWMLALPVRAATAPSSANLDALAEQYVRLVLAVGEHDSNMVDAYYGPSQWRDDARAAKKSLSSLSADASRLAEQLRQDKTPDARSIQRRRALSEQVDSIRARLDILGGTRLPFDEEARRIYGVAPPHHDDAFYRAIHRELDEIVPGQGPLKERMEALKKKVTIPSDRLRPAMETGLAVCRGETLKHIPLPANENFRLELVKDQPWGAYNRYQGGFQSLIEVNVGLPVYADSAASLMCHEGYPGHHVLNVLLEQTLVRDRGWIEYTVYPLFSAQSLLAEGTADFGLDLVFPGELRWQWERDTLFPIAGIDPSLAELRYRVAQLNKSLAYASIDAARAYLDGKRSADQTIAWLQEFTFATPEEAKRRLSFFDTYRSYVVNYRLGQDLIQQHIDKVAGADLDARWNAFIDLLSSPPVVSDLAKGTTLDPSRQAPK